MNFFPQNFCLQNNSKINASLHDLKVFQLFFLSLFSKYVFGLGKTIAGNILGWITFWSRKNIVLIKDRDFSCYWHFYSKHYFVSFVMIWKVNMLLSKLWLGFIWFQTIFAIETFYLSWKKSEELGSLELA